MRKNRTSTGWFLVVGVLFGMIGFVIAQGMGAKVDASVLTGFVLGLLGAAGSALFFGGR